MKPRVFIGSSKESIEFARAVQHNLQDDAEVVVWDQGLFGPSQFVLEGLIEELKTFCFGIFIFSPDDVFRIRGKQLKGVRDNVVFELGLFIGRLGRLNNFILVPQNIKLLRLPSDLSGITYLQYETDRSDNNLIAAVATACNSIRKRFHDTTQTPASAAQPGSDLSDICERALKIYHGFYRSPPTIEILNHIYEFRIDSNGNCNCREKRTCLIREHQYAIDMFGIGANAPLESFEAAEISAGCKDDEPCRLTLLPAQNHQSQKKFVLFFLPALSAGDQIEYFINWKWPGMWRDLVQGRPANWSGKPNPLAHVRRMEFRFLVPGSMQRLSLKNHGKGGGTIAGPRKHAAAKSSEYRIVIEDLKPGEGYMIELRPAVEKKARAL